ncbi:MAG TPA: dTDP-4-amino-4,6-dideoxygalactose transaminase [Thermoanaerobaculia bacterium]|nr:dTDP-4-amino-4,6-dideoxygalactose transaminase [Thermoanaerobaculia bacterium]
MTLGPGGPAIPFNRPSFVGRERQYMDEALALGHVSGDGAFTRRCHDLLRAELGTPSVLLTTSCTHALEMAALLLDIRPGDEVVVPDFTFVSTANAFVLRGARPVFADIRSDTLNLDERLLERHLGPRTRAIVPVHYAGVGCAMGDILAIAKSRGVAVVEDNAHGLFGKRGGRFLGTQGALATLSFHETKNFSCGEGGALLVNDERYVARAEIIREKGTDRKRFFRGEVDKYTWVDLGSSYLPSDLLAAYLLGQLEQKTAVLAARRRIFASYREGLAAWAEMEGAALPTIPADCEPSYHMFYVVMPTADARARLIASLKSRGILAVFHYLPLHLSEMGRRFGGRPGDCPVSASVSERLVRLPFYTSFGEADQRRVIDAVCEFR